VVSTFLDRGFEPYSVISLFVSLDVRELKSWQEILVYFIVSMSFSSAIKVDGI